MKEDFSGKRFNEAEKAHARPSMSRLQRIQSIGGASAFLGAAWLGGEMASAQLHVDPPDPLPAAVVAEVAGMSDQLNDMEEIVRQSPPTEEGMNEARKRIATEVVPFNDEQKEAYNQLQHYSDEVVDAAQAQRVETIWNNALDIGGAFGALYYGADFIKPAMGRLRTRNELKNAKRELGKTLELDPEELEEQIEGMRMLPTIGSKIFAFSEARETVRQYNIEPSVTTGSQVENVSKHCTVLPLFSSTNTRFFIHQMTVPVQYGQGFVPSAMALIANSPHQYDWNTPMFSAYWGEFGAMVHDGGARNENVGGHWGKGKADAGRTDFLYRYMKIPKGENELPDTEVTRMRFEMEYYRRAALTFACSDPSLVPFIEEGRREELWKTWQTMESTMHEMYSDYGLGDVFTPKWFTDRPQNMLGENIYGSHRFETGFPDDVRDSLLRVEEVRKTEPMFRIENANLMHEFTDRVNQIIGIRRMV